jgi:hypothetical protein
MRRTAVARRSLQRRPNRSSNTRMNPAERTLAKAVDLERWFFRHRILGRNSARRRLIGIRKGGVVPSNRSAATYTVRPAQNKAAATIKTATFRMMVTSTAGRRELKRQIELVAADRTQKSRTESRRPAPSCRSAYWSRRCWHPDAASLHRTSHLQAFMPVMRPRSRNEHD